MKKIMTTIMRALMISVFILFGCLYGKAQVTIGSSLDPVKGALLELKDHASTASDSTNASQGGLVLPRVKLKKKATLEPFISENDAEWKGGKDKISINHIGLMVYNLTNNAEFQQGIYVWTALGWKQLEIASDYIYAPSFNLPWNDTSFNIYEAYKKNFKPALSAAHYISSKGTGANAFVAFPDFESSPDAFYYVVTDYDPAVLTVKDISADGIIRYQKNLPDIVPPEDAYLNVIMIRK